MTDPRRPLGYRRQVPWHPVVQKQMNDDLLLGDVDHAALRRRFVATNPVNSTAPRWTPVGPSAVLDVQRRYVVGGIVHDLAVSDDGMRAYAASPRGGVWYTGDAAANWVPLGGWGYDRPHEDASGLSCSCLLVHFGAEAVDDFVMVGTGEPDLVDTAVAPVRFGVGILWAKAPAGGGRWSNDPITVQVPNHAPFIVYQPILRMARHPDARPEADYPVTANGRTWQEDRVVAVTLLGIYLGTWSLDPPQFTWRTIMTAAQSTALGSSFADVAWLRRATGRDGRIVLALTNGALLYTDNAGLTWATLTGPGAYSGHPAFAAVQGERLYLLNTRTGPVHEGVVLRVPDEPGDLLEVGTVVPQPSRSDGPVDPIITRAIAVQPEPQGAELIVVSHGAAGLDASVWAYRGAAELPGVILPATDLTGEATASPTAGFIGAGVHSDVHAIRIVDQGKQVWLATDGGVFVSVEGGRRHTFADRSVGLAAIDANFVATHPLSSQHLAVGATNTGVLVRSGDAVWSEYRSGEGGGVAFDAAPPYSLIGQYAQAEWHSRARRFRPPASTVIANKPRNDDRESKASALFSGVAATATTAASGSRVAIGTNRVWVTDNLEFGPTIWKVLPYTAAGAQPALAKLARDALTDGRSRRFGVPAGDPLGPVQTDMGPLGPVTTIKWVSPTQLLALFMRGLVRWTEEADQRWRSELVIPPTYLSTRYTDVCPVPGTGGFYLTARPTGDSSMDTCTFVDSTGILHPAGLRQPNEPVDPAFSVVVDPIHPDRVYVGTYTGVWGSVRSGTTHGPWTLVGRGLPPVAIQDLGIWVDPDHDPLRPERRVRLLRAATQARGVWELELSETHPARTYLRVHGSDDRLRLPTPLARPWPAELGDEVIYNGPDIMVRPRFGTAAVFPPNMWVRQMIDANMARDHAYTIWTAQTALRWLYPAVRADGRWSDRFVAGLRAFAVRSGIAMTGAEMTRELFEAIVRDIKLPFDPADPFAPPANPANLPAAVFRAPWHTRANPQGCATELDFQFIVPPYRLDREALWIIDRPLCTVDVLIHHRSTQPLGANGAFCVVLWRNVEHTGQAMALSADGLAQYARAVAAAANPAAVAEPAGWGWNVVRTAGNPVHRLPVALEASMPRAVSVDVDFTTAERGILVVAIAGSFTGSVFAQNLISSADQLTKPEPPAGTPIRDFVRQWPYAAARYVRKLSF